MKGEATKKNISKQVIRVQKLHQRLDNIRTNYINKTVDDLAKTKPNYITIEDLSAGMKLTGTIMQALIRETLKSTRQHSQADVGMYRWLSREFTPVDCYIKCQ